MRVAAVSLRTAHHEETDATGRFRTVLELLRDGGHDVHVLCARWWPDDRDVVADDGITYHGLVPTRDAGRSFCWRLPIAIRRLGADVVHVAAEPPAQVLAARWGTTLSNVPLVAEWTGANGSKETRDYRRAARRADAVVTPSRLVRTWVRELGVDGEDVAVVPDPIDLDRIRSIEPADSTDVVYARRLDEGANLESVLLGLAELRTKDWTATVVGDGPRRGAYQEMARELRIDDRIDFVGAADRDERIAIYRGGHVFAQTAEFCLYPTELAWALACGCVGVVEYHVDSAGHELVEGRERGFRTTSETELTDAIVTAGQLERTDFDDSFEALDRRAVRNQYLNLYETLQDEAGLF
ncbi:glycosyltransferase [Halovivax gelatinilyticus]|uniref:glycosyltransferase n=1 Tax=Halovivax gelatinilyticus TaxID=2961597 RepID=UPI0020CA3512|nr:glycosyltransferase [Halovivax gelatinilyticus]